MRKRLDLSQVLKTYEGDVIKESNTPGAKGSDAMTLKRVVLNYLRNAGQMGINDSEQQSAYELGFVIGSGDKEIIISTSQYDVLKKLADKGKVKNQQGEEITIYGIEVKYQAKEMIDLAEDVEEDKKKK